MFLGADSFSAYIYSAMDYRRFSVGRDLSLHDWKMM